VLDARGRTPAHARVLDRSAPTLICVGPDADPAPLRARGADVAVLPPGDGAGLDLDAVLAQLWSREIRSVLVEGGAGVLSAFLRARRFDRLHVHVAPLVLGSTAAPAFHAGPGTLADAARLCLERLERAGDDVLITYQPAAPPAAPEEG
jgi:diaminohydroxyphosphoribosylaminopyrimidine deaminase/5-amino-6-(5-phosphoribosylamino)uracil reductase